MRVNKTIAKKIEKSAGIVTEALKSGGKVLIAGNGGSASQAEHFAAELVGRYQKKGRKPLAVISLTSNTALLTALANDFGYQNVFSRQIEALGKPCDVFIGISTSGKSKNIIKAAGVAKKLGLLVISLVGQNYQKLAPFSDIIVSVPLKNTPKVQEMHLFILHCLCELIEKEF